MFYAVSWYDSATVDYETIVFLLSNYLGSTKQSRTDAFLFLLFYAYMDKPRQVSENISLPYPAATLGVNQHKWSAYTVFNLVR